MEINLNEEFKSLIRNSRKELKNIIPSNTKGDWKEKSDELVKELESYLKKTVTHTSAILRTQVEPEVTLDYWIKREAARLEGASKLGIDFEVFGIPYNSVRDRVGEEQDRITALREDRARLKKGRVLPIEKTWEGVNPALEMRFRNFRRALNTFYSRGIASEVIYSELLRALSRGGHCLLDAGKSSVYSEDWWDIEEVYGFFRYRDLIIAWVDNFTWESRIRKDDPNEFHKRERKVACINHLDIRFDHVLSKDEGMKRIMVLGPVNNNIRKTGKDFYYVGSEEFDSDYTNFNGCYFEVLHSKDVSGMYVEVEDLQNFISEIDSMDFGIIEEEEAICA